VGILWVGAGRWRLGVMVMAAGMGAFAIGAWRVHLPLVAAYNQGPVMELMGETYREGGELAFYETVSYAALFYGQRDILMLATYKFAGDPARLDTPGERPLYLVAPTGKAERLSKEHPGLKPVRTVGGLALLRLAAKGERSR
jgi:hypothetical protein